MGTMRLGHDTRKLPQGQRPILEKLVETPVTTIIQEKVVETKTETQHHHHTETILKEVKTQDKLARRHSKLSARRTEKMVDDLTEILNQQNEVLHAVNVCLSDLRKENADLTVKISILQAQKPEEKHTVTVEKHTTEVAKPQKALTAGVILAVILSVAALVLK